MTTSVHIDYSSYDYAQLAQNRPSGTSAISLLSPDSNERFIVLTLVIANTTGSDATYSIYHDVDGTTYDQTTALAYGVSLAANSLIAIELSIPMITSADNLAIQTNTTDALTFTAYGMKKKV